MRPSGDRDQGGEFAVFLPESLPPTGDDFAIRTEGFLGGGFTVKLVKVQDFHALFGDLAGIEQSKAMEHVISPPIAFNTIKRVELLHLKLFTPDVAFVS